MSAVDRVLNQIKRHQEAADLPPDCLARFLCTKSSWRGKYRRIICITPTTVVTQYPDTLAITNTWQFTADSDIDAISVAPSGSEEPEFILSARTEKRGKFKPQKFGCQQRNTLLSILYQAIAFAAFSGTCNIATKLLGSADVYPAYKLRRGQWVPVQLRLSAYAVDRLDPAGQVRWSLEFRNMAKPAARFLASDQSDPPGVFALLGKVGRVPRVYASRDREALLRAMQTVAFKRMGISLAVDTQAVLSGHALLEAVGAAEREVAATAAQEPVGQWEAVRVRPVLERGAGTSQALLASPAEAKAALEAPNGSGRRRGVARRVVLTTSAILERRTATYEVAERRPLAAIAAIVRFADEPQWLAFEWTDGTPPSMFITPARDALLAATLDTAQAAASRCIPVLGQHTFPGDVVLAGSSSSGLSPPTAGDRELDRFCLGHLTVAARGAFANMADAPVPPSPEEGRSTDGDDSDALSVGSPPPEGLLRRKSGVGGMAASLGARAASDARAPALRSSAASTHSVQEAIVEFRKRIAEFNACVPYSGLPLGTKIEEGVIAALLSLLPLPLPAAACTPPGSADTVAQVAVLHCLQRLAASPSGANALVSISGAPARICATLTQGHDHMGAEGAWLLLRLWYPAFGRFGLSPWQLPAASSHGNHHAPHTAATDESTASTAKSLILSQTGRCTALLGLLRAGGDVGALSPLAGMAALAACVCAPGSRTTDPILLHALLAEAAGLGRPLFLLFSHPARSVLDATALVMHAIAEGGASAAAPMREAALSDGAILLHLSFAVAAKGGSRAKLSRDLVSLWADDYAPALALLRRMFPPGLLRYLSAPSAPSSSSAEDQSSVRADRARNISLQKGTQQGLQAKEAASVASQRPGLLSPSAQAQRTSASPLSPVSSPPRRSLEEGKQEEDASKASQPGKGEAGLRARPRANARQRSAGRKGNWDAFWGQVDRDHCHAGLLWNEQTRAELRTALQAEEGALAAGRARTASKAGGARCTWNHAEFRVEYPSLAKELCVGDIYIRLLLEGLDQGAVQKVPAPKELFQALYSHFLRLADIGLREAAVNSTGASSHSFNLSGLTAFVVGDPERDRQLCVRAMAAVYHEHAGAVGVFDGMAHAVALLDRTTTGALRDALLSLVHALLAPTCAATSDAASRAAAANGAAYVRVGGTALAVDLIAGAHAAQERAPAQLQSNLIAYSSHRQEVKEWHYYPDSSAASRPRDAPLEEGQAGPLSRDEIKQGCARGKLTTGTLFWAAGMMHPLPLGSIRELRWLVSSHSGGSMGPFARAEVALQVLLALAQMQPSTDATGQALQPLPILHRQLASPHCLPHLAQVLLTGEPVLVSLAAALLEAVVDHNTEALGRLTSTGIFFFALAYCGSNLVELARLFHVAHLQTGQPMSAASTAGGQLAQRSVLGAMLPESLLYVLTTAGPGAFAAALVADSDTPELVWTHRMRAQVLVPQMYQHIGDLPRRLPERNGALYDYVACPPIVYPELRDEMWCHRYYLRNLCDTERFPDWPIVDHVPFLQALLDEWRAEVARTPLAMSEAEACKVLGLKPNSDGVVGEDDLKSAYRSLARKYHPDRNPAGREQFQAVAQAYERLQAGAAGGQGPQTWRILLLLKAQCILFRRYPRVLEPFKYAGYPLLLQAVTLPEDSDDQSAASQPGKGPSNHVHWLAPENVPQLQAALELCWLTCVSSQLNGEELARSGGVAILGNLLSRCAAVLPTDAAPSMPAAVLATHALRTFAGMAAFTHARRELLARPGLVSDIVRACSLERAAAAVDAALQAIIQMCALAELQELMLQQGVLGYLVPLLLGYDSTLGEESAGEEAASAQLLAEEGAGGPQREVAAYLGLSMQRTNMQAARNLHAMLAARALGCLAGALPGARATPRNVAAQEALSSLLTPPLAIRLCDADPRTLLVQLSSSISNPQVIWNSKMREQLLAQMEAVRANPALAQPSADFQYTAIEDELVVAGVFVRIYNEQPAFALDDPEAFAKGLVSWIHASAGVTLGPQAQIQARTDADEAEEAAEQVARQRAHLTGALTALRNVVEANPRLAALLASKPALAPLLNCLDPICRRLHLPLEAVQDSNSGLLEQLAVQQKSQLAQVVHEAEAAALALAVLVRLTAHAGCVEALAEVRAVLFSLWLVHRPPSSTVQMLALRLLHALAGTPAAAWAAATHAGTVFLLTVLLPAHNGAANEEATGGVRAAVAVLLGRMTSQPLHGPRVVLLLGCLLPLALVAAIQEGPGEAAVAALDQPSESPERVWTPHMATTTAEEVSHLASTARSSQAHGQLQWSLPRGFQLQFDSLANELYVGGVYVRLFLKNPRFPLRAPKAFIEGLMEAYVTAVRQGDVDRVLLLAAAAVELLRVHPLLGDHATSLGYVDSLLKLLASRLPPTPGDAQQGKAPDELGGTGLRLLHQLAASQAGAEALARGAPPPVPALMQAGRVWGVGGSVLALETLQRALQLGNRARSLLVGSALGAGLVAALLAKLDWRSRPQHAPAEEQERDEAVERVVAVEVLHLLAAEGLHAAAVQELLDASEVWRAYRDQKHDLFLPAGGSQQGGAVALLKGSQAARFALPAPDAPVSSSSATPGHTTQPHLDASSLPQQQPSAPEEPSAPKEPPAFHPAHEAPSAADSLSPPPGADTPTPSEAMLALQRQYQPADSDAAEAGPADDEESSSPPAPMSSSGVASAGSQQHAPFHTSAGGMDPADDAAPLSGLGQGVPDPGPEVSTALPSEAEEASPVSEPRQPGGAPPSHPPTAEAAPGSQADAQHRGSNDVATVPSGAERGSHTEARAAEKLSSAAKEARDSLQLHATAAAALPPPVQPEAEHRQQPQPHSPQQVSTPPGTSRARACAADARGAASTAAAQGPEGSAVHSTQQQQSPPAGSSAPVGAAQPPVVAPRQTALTQNAAPGPPAAASLQPAVQPSSRRTAPHVAGPPSTSLPATGSSSPEPQRPLADPLVTSSPPSAQQHSPPARGPPQVTSASAGQRQPGIKSPTPSKSSSSRSVKDSPMQQSSVSAKQDGELRRSVVDDNPLGPLG